MKQFCMYKTSKHCESFFTSGELTLVEERSGRTGSVGQTVVTLYMRRKSLTV